jgi:hypothetical protein
MWYIVKVDMVHKKLTINKSFGSFNCDLTQMCTIPSKNCKGF